MTVTMSNQPHYVIKAVWDGLPMELIPDVFLVTIDWWSEITTSVIKQGTLKSPYKIMQQPNEHFKLLQVYMNLYSSGGACDNMVRATRSEIKIRIHYEPIICWNDNSFFKLLCFLCAG